MNDHVAELLLQEFRAFRDTEFREFREDVASWKQDSGERLAKLESEVMTGVSGNGQPSRLAVVESKVQNLERLTWIVSGVIIAVQAAVGALAHWWPWGHK